MKYGHRYKLSDPISETPPRDSKMKGEITDQVVSPFVRLTSVHRNIALGIWPGNVPQPEKRFARESDIAPKQMAFQKEVDPNRLEKKTRKCTDLSVDIDRMDETQDRLEELGISDYHNT